MTPGKMSIFPVFLTLLLLWVIGILAADQKVQENSSLILAANRTHRRDPLNHLKRYGGGWNIKNKHYWASVGFTGAPYFGIAIAWFALFGISLCGLLIYHFCKKRVDVKLHPHAYTISLILLIICTCGGIAGSIMLYNGQGQFNHIITHTLDFVVREAENTVQNLRNVTDIISLALVNEVDAIFLPVAQQQRVDSINRKLKNAANTLESKTNDNSHKIKKVLNAVRVALICLASVMLTLAFAGFISSLCGLKPLVYSLVLIAWILVTATFILSGIFLLLTNVVGDTCVSMEQWVAQPYADTSLDEILPCVDVGTAEQSLTQSKQVTKVVVDRINSVVSSIFNTDQRGSSIISYNQSGPAMPLLCNPYTSQLEVRNCTSGEVSLEDASQVWKNYTCSVSSSGNCITSGRVTPEIYNVLNLAVEISYGLYKYAPFLINLEDCTFVREAFTNVTTDYCPDLRKQLRWVYIGLTCVGTGILLSIVFWVIYSKQRTRMEEYYKEHSSPKGAQFIVGAGEREVE